MRADPNAYSELNEHHARLEGEKRQRQQEELRARERPNAYQELKEQHASLETERDASSAPALDRNDRDLDVDNLAQSPEQKRVAELVASQNMLWQGEFGEESAISREHIAAIQRTAAKGLPPDHERGELGDLLRAHKSEEQQRLTRLEHEQEVARQTGAQADLQQQHQPSLEVNDSRQVESGKEKTDPDQREARYASFVSQLEAKERAEKVNENEGRE
jgi:hypothetical protein